MLLRNFIVFEGSDGAGTTTQSGLLVSKLKDLLAAGSFPRQITSIFSTSEPTGAPVGKFLRSILSGAVKVSDKTAAYLFAADRCEHIFGEGGILEHINCGELVISDRYALSSLVYQGLRCGRELPEMLNSPFPAPEFLFFFDVDAETAFKRVESRGEGREIYEYLDFQVKAREMYKKLLPLCEKSGSTVKVFDASPPVERISADVLAYLLPEIS